LPKDDGQQFRTDVAFVRIGDGEDHVTLHHELVLAAGEGPSNPRVRRP
jgi:hypothetical protein